MYPTAGAWTHHHVTLIVMRLLSILLLLLLPALASGFGQAAFHLPASARRSGPSSVRMLARTPVRPPQRPHSKVPVQAPGQHDLASLRTNQPLAGRVLGVYDGRCVGMGLLAWRGLWGLDWD